MTLSEDYRSVPERRLRLWPALALGLPVLLVRFVLPAFIPSSVIIGILVGLAGAVGIGVWWLFFSRGPLPERLLAAALVVAGMAATCFALHPSIATGMAGLLYFFYALPCVALAFVAWACLTPWLTAGTRRTLMVATILISCGGWALLRTDGISGGGNSDFHWRWSQTPEERLLALSAGPSEASETVIPVSSAKPEWPGFRGSSRDAVVRGVRISTEWATTPPLELWRRQIGPGWSSFAVWGDRVFTQEQRGDEEIVACYSAATGEPLWRHADAARFWESNAGPGPRATPTIFDGRVYAQGATGILNALDANTGGVIWTRNSVADTGIEIPGWGISGSPLIFGDQVVVAASGRLMSYDIESGERRWEGPARKGSYCSPHLVRIGGVSQIVMTGGAGVFSVAPDDGRVLWEHAWEGAPMLQPAQLENGDLLVTTASASGGAGLRRLAIEQASGAWQVAERWSSSSLKPYFNDFVVHNGHAYGFDGAILACIELEKGERRWKGGRYGHGQIILLADQDLLLVLSEQGEMALVKAAPDQFTELARRAAITGKTWNHPVLVGDQLFVRNGEEVAAFRLALVGP
jgi:outer membrane protein assembly factor BamB